MLSGNCDGAALWRPGSPYLSTARGSFFRLRLLCSALMAGLYPILATRFGRKHYHFQGLVLLFLPSATIAWMIYATEGPRHRIMRG